MPSLNMDGPEQWQQYVCVRNRRWLSKILQKGHSEHEFYALGIAHLIPAPWSGADCPDLLSLLQQNGMSVELLK